MKTIAFHPRRLIGALAAAAVLAAAAAGTAAGAPIGNDNWLTSSGTCNGQQVQFLDPPGPGPSNFAVGGSAGRRLRPGREPGQAHTLLDHRSQRSDARRHHRRAVRGLGPNDAPGTLTNCSRRHRRGRSACRPGLLRRRPAQPDRVASDRERIALRTRTRTETTTCRSTSARKARASATSGSSPTRCSTAKDKKLGYDAGVCTFTSLAPPEAACQITAAQFPERGPS
jgi:hypothetical protein